LLSQLSNVLEWIMPGGKSRLLRALAGVLVGLLVVGLVVGLGVVGDRAQAADAPDRYVAFCAAGETDVADADCVHVLEIGASGARRVVILVPGHSEAAGLFRDVGRYLSQTVPDTQVWAFDRREQNLTDPSHFGCAGELQYYLQQRYRAVTGKAAPDTRGWGLSMELAGLRRVVLAAGAGGRRVFLGGHSSGAGTALAYAAWDFDGAPGYEGLAGLVLIDGGTHRSFDGEQYKIQWLKSVQEVATRLAKIDAAASPFTGDLSYVWQVPGAPESVAIDYQLAGDYALRDPHGASALQKLLPAAMQPPFPVTNAALLGWLLDTHAPAPDLQLHSGHIAPTGALRDWINDGPADIADVAFVFAQSQPAAEEWYWPRRLSLDITAVDPMEDSPITRRLGLRLTHARDINVPLYVFETGLTHGTVVAAAKWVVANSRIKDPVYVTDDAMVHLDPLLDAPPRNRFLTTVAQFLIKH
jgi:hypothetical protein